MPLYEVVLRLPHGDETRLADRNGYEVGGEVVIDFRRYVVVGTEPPQWRNASERFVLKPAAEDEPPGGGPNRETDPRRHGRVVSR